MCQFTVVAQHPLRSHPFVREMDQMPGHSGAEHLFQSTPLSHLPELERHSFQRVGPVVPDPRLKGTRSHRRPDPARPPKPPDTTVPRSGNVAPIPGCAPPPGGSSPCRPGAERHDQGGGRAASRLSAVPAPVRRRVASRPPQGSRTHGSRSRRRRSAGHRLPGWPLPCATGASGTRDLANVRSVQGEPDLEPGDLPDEGRPTPRGRGQPRLSRLTRSIGRAFQRARSGRSSRARRRPTVQAAAGLGQLRVAR